MPARHAGEAAARARGAGRPARRRPRPDPGRRADHLRDPSRHRRRRSTGQVPRGSVLPARRVPDRAALARRAGRGRAAAGGAFHRHASRTAGRRASRTPRSTGWSAHGWPGNVRELRNVVERANILYPGQDDRRGAGRAAARSPRPRQRRRTRRACGRRARPSPLEAVPAPDPSPPASAEADPRHRWPAAVDLRPSSPRSSAAISSRRWTIPSGVVADAARMLSLQRTTLIEKMRKYEMKAA